VDTGSVGLVRLGWSLVFALAAFFFGDFSRSKQKTALFAAI
jgi:hypothetical protein